MSYAEKGFAEAVELARHGDRHAQLHLKRIAKRDPDSPMGRMARQALAESNVDSLQE